MSRPGSNQTESLELATQRSTRVGVFIGSARAAGKARRLRYDERQIKPGFIAFVKTYLDGYRVASTLIPSADGAKASLFATIGSAAKAIGLFRPQRLRSVEGKTCSSDPFKLQLRDGKLCGHGSPT